MGRFGFVGAAVAVLLLVNSAVAAASGWSIEHTPTPNGGSSSQMNAVSCPSTSACTAVGTYYNGTSYVTLAERWSGTMWSIERTPSPTGALDSVLEGVSCVSVSACTAIGYYYNGTNSFALAERWNGTKWSIERTPNPIGGRDRVLEGVSCVSVSACIAVGSYNSGTGSSTLAERWNGTKWSIQQTPNPTGGSNSFLSGVSCTSAGTCTAVGFYYNDATNSFTLAENWNGTRWSIRRTPNLTGASSLNLRGVSCVSATVCTAVGSYKNGMAYVMLAERWNGTTWSIQHTPNPTGASSLNLYGVSCASASACTAVGLYNNGGADVTLAERWNGTTWSIQQAVNPSGAPASVLYGVSCGSASVCTSVGDYSTSTAEVTLAERWDAPKWSIQRAPSPAGGSASDLVGVGCVSASVCTAVGSYRNGTSLLTLAERWNGSKWSIQPTPNPAGSSASSLNDVSCGSVSACATIGYYNNGTSNATLAERWNGTKWLIVHTPTPPGASTTWLAGVSCASASACTAVGYYSNATTEVTLAERWNGSKWSIQQTPNPTGGSNSDLNAVSCASASACTAVGYYFNGTSGVTLAERWNGTSWSIERTPNPSGVSYSQLLGVSCASTRVCTAVGDYSTNGTVTVPLTERWNGTKWSIEDTPSPTGGSNSNLNAVSCGSASACTAVGQYSNGTTGVTLAERWNGTKWSIDDTANPTGGSNSNLNDVGCVSASACTAVGQYSNGTTDMALAERRTAPRRQAAAP